MLLFPQSNVTTDELLEMSFQCANLDDVDISGFIYEEFFPIEQINSQDIENMLNSFMN